MILPERVFGRLAAAYAFVGGDDDPGFAAGNALGEAVRREATEHHGMDRTDARAGQHRVSRLRNYRHVDGDAIALAHIPQPQNVRHLAHFVVQFAVSDLLGIGRIVALPDDRDLIAALFEMTIDAVIGGVQHAIFEPLDGNVAGLVGNVVDFAEGMNPMNVLGRFLSSEAAGVLGRTLIHLAILGVVDIGALGPLR